MGEAFIKEAGGDRFEVESAGIEPWELNPIMVQAMMEIGIDISRNRNKEVADFIRRGDFFDSVVTVFDEASAERCHIFRGSAKRHDGGFPAPSALQGTVDEKLQAVRNIRDDIRAKVDDWVSAFA